MRIAAFSKSYNGVPAIRMPEIELAPGRICAVVGANGSGKSTLARVLAGVERADGGAALAPTVAVGYMPQKSYAFRMSVLSNVRLGGGSEAEAMELLRALDIGKLSKRRAKGLSGGETARMALARVLLRECELLILDEPTASMDVEATMRSEELIKSRCEETNCQLLLITHSLQQARRLAQDAIFLHKGELKERGEAGEVLYSPKEPETKRFIEFYGI